MCPTRVVTWQILKNTHDTCVWQACRTRFGHDTTPWEERPCYIVVHCLVLIVFMLPLKKVVLDSTSSLWEVSFVMIFVCFVGCWILMFTLVLFSLEVESDDHNLLFMTLLLLHHMFIIWFFYCLFAYCDFAFIQGHNNLQPFSPPNPDDVATLCYTSGTTGTPKVLILFYCRHNLRKLRKFKLFCRSQFYYLYSHFSLLFY